MIGRSNYSQVTEVLGQTTLFYIERSLDSEIVVYEANRSGNILNPPFVDLYWTNYLALNKREVVSTKAQELFFGVKVKKEDGKHKICMAALPSKIITLHLKKNGSVVAKTVINGKEAKIYKIFANMETKGILPVVTSLTIYGEHKKQLVSEEMDITEDIRDSFDVSSFLPSLSDFVKVF